MTRLAVTYLGLPLASPVIVGACGLNRDLDRLRRAEDAGAGAVVLPSLFEEQVQLERYRTEVERERAMNRHPEMIDPFPPDNEAGPEPHLRLVGRAVDALDIPVIASLNATSPDTWSAWSRALVDAGAAALELNLYRFPEDPGRSEEDLLAAEVEVVRRVAAEVTVPVAVKLSSAYTNPLRQILALARAGAAGCVLFNRFVEPDIDPGTLCPVTRFYLSRPQDLRVPLRYAGLLWDRDAGDVCCGTGVESGRDVAKLLVAGATCVQAVSTFYRHGVGHVHALLAELTAWLDEHGFPDLAACRGRLGGTGGMDPWRYVRAQYIEALMDPAGPIGALDRDKEALRAGTDQKVCGQALAGTGGAVGESHSSVPGPQS